MSEHDNQPELEHELLPQYVIDTGEHDGNFCFFRNNILQYETATQNMSSAEDRGRIDTRTINKSKIRQVRRSAVYQFGFLIPKDYKQALQLDEQNGNSKWYDATELEMDQINDYKVFQDHGKAQYDPKSRKVSNAPN